MRKLLFLCFVPGVLVGHSTLIKGDSVRTGVTAILPHNGNIFQQKIPAAIYMGNGFGKLSGITQVMELGNIDAPVILTNTLNVAVAMEAVIEHTLQQPGNAQVQSVTNVSINQCKHTNPKFSNSKSQIQL